MVRGIQNLLQARHSSDSRYAAGFGIASWVVLLATAFIVYADGYWSLVQTWQRTGEYRHGFLILPIALWLAYISRCRLNGVVLRPSAWGIIGLMLASTVWAYGSLQDINILVHAGVVSIIPFSILAFFGSDLFMRMLFPIAYLFLAIPVDSKWLVPFLQMVTAQGAESMLHLLGVPVFREGTLLSLPVADFEVAEACSGYRFLIAMVVIMLAIAWVYYQTVSKRLVFMVIAMGMALVVNMIRVTGILFLAQNRGLASSVHADHVLYGWQLYVVIIVLLTIVGAWWSDGNRFGRNGSSIRVSVETMPHEALWTLVASLSVLVPSRFVAGIFA